MIGYSDEQILKGILRHDNLILQHIYKQYYYNINYFIRKNQGSDDDASDIFQEAVIIIYRKIKENDLVFDPFAGSNTTGATAESLKRKWLTVEIDEDFAKQSIYRFENIK